MRLEPLYRIRFTYPESWAVGLDGGWQQLFFLAEGRAVIPAEDGAVIMVEGHGYGRACPPGRRQVVGALFHLADREPYRRLNDLGGTMSH